MGGWGREYRIPPQNTPEEAHKNPKNWEEMHRRNVYVFLLNSLSVGFLCASSGVFWGGIRYSLHVFSWERITHGTSHETQHGNHRVDHEKNCEAIYWKYHTSHLITQNFTQYLSKHSFFTKSSFLLGISKIPYQNTVELFSRYFYNSSHKNLITSSSSHQEYM